jgi:hypothetical protein
MFSISKGLNLKRVFFIGVNHLATQHPQLFDKFCMLVLHELLPIWALPVTKNFYLSFHLYGQCLFLIEKIPERKAT